ncbi:MAG: hypothetical protein ACLRFP_02945, partial [Alphaproteobacteria bacterium]
MSKTKSQEEILTQIYNMYCPTSWFRRDIFDKNVHNDPEYIKKLTGMDISTFGKALNVHETYAPTNLSLQDFLRMLKEDPKLLDDIHGNFSSFNPELSKIFKQYKAGKITGKQFRKDVYYAINEEALFDVPDKYADIYTS